MKYFLPFLAIFFVINQTACNDSPLIKVNAQGKGGELIVLADESLKEGSVGDFFRENFEELLETFPQPEKRFDISYLNAAAGNMIERSVKGNKSVFFVATTQTDNYANQVINENLTEEEKSAAKAGTTNIFKRENLWARGQLVYFVLAETPEKIIESLSNSKDAIIQELNDLERLRLAHDMFELERQTDIEEGLLNKHKFTLNIQHDYFVALDTTNFIWLRRQPLETRRELMIYYLDEITPEMLTEEWVLQQRDFLTKTFMRSLDDSAFVATFIPQEPSPRLVAQKIDFNGREGIETRGLWRLVYQKDSGDLLPLEGGPFVNYSFYEPSQKRLYMIDGMVFAPKFDKREFLRQMEVIAYTFRTASDVAKEQEKS